MAHLFIIIKDRTHDLARFLSPKAAVKVLQGTLGAAAGVFLLNVVFQGLLFATSILLARLLGSSGYGIYAYAISWTFILFVPADLGIARLLVRNVAAYCIQGELGLLRGVIQWARGAVFLNCLIITFLAGVVAWALKAHIDSHMLKSFWMALILLPALTQTRLLQATIMGLNQVLLAQISEQLFQPVLFIILIMAAFMFKGSILSADQAIGLNALATGAAFVLGLYFLNNVFPKRARKARCRYEPRIWLGSAIPMALTEGVYSLILRIDILMLGAMKGAEAVGIYNAAGRGAELTGLILISINYAVGPTIARLYAQGETDHLQSLVRRSARIGLLCSVPIAAILIIFGPRFLLLYGPDFVQGRMALSILSMGTIVNLFFGPASLLLIMSNQERLAVIGAGAGVAVKLILNVVLIPAFGLEGAATATVIGNVVCNVLLVLCVHKSLGMLSTVAGRRG